MADPNSNSSSNASKAFGQSWLEQKAAVAPARITFNAATEHNPVISNPISDLDNNLGNVFGTLQSSSSSSSRPFGAAFRARESVNVKTIFTRAGPPAEEAEAVPASKQSPYNQPMIQNHEWETDKNGRIKNYDCFRNPNLIGKGGQGEKHAGNGPYPQEFPVPKPSKALLAYRAARAAR